MQKKYIINGKEYNSLDEVPAEHRASLEAFEKIATSGKGFFGMVRLLFSMAFRSISSAASEESVKVDAQPSSANTPPQPVPPNDVSSREGKGFFNSRHFRVMLGMLVVALIVYVLKINRNETQEEDGMSYDLPADAVEESQIESTSVASDRYALLIDDPNEPPYNVFVGLYDEGRLLLRFDLPNGELEETDEKNVINLVSGAGNETNLVSKRIKLTWNDEWTADDSWNQVRVGGKAFFSLSQLDYAAGQHYRTQYYAYPYRNGSVIIEVLYHLQNADLAANVEKFDVQGDLKQLEQVLATLEEAEQTP